MADRAIFVFTLVLAGAYFYATEKLPSLEIGDPLGPKAFPRLLALALVITAVVMLLEIIRKAKGKAAPVPRSDVPGRVAHPKDRGAYGIVAGVVVWTFLYFLIFERLGYVLATIPYLLGLMSYFNKGKWVANVLTAVLFCVGSYLMFTKILGVNLARGILPF